MANLNQKFERTYCKCGQCKAVCRTLPGNLAPGDLERISDYLEVTAAGGELTPAFLANFQASEGELVKRDGELMRIPTIVPAQRANGRCVFLSKKDECTISPVAPFACSQFNVCDGPKKRHEQTKRSHAVLNAIMASVAYIQWYSWLMVNRPMAKPLVERKAAFEKELDKLNERRMGTADDLFATMDAAIADKHEDQHESKNELMQLMEGFQSGGELTGHGAGAAEFGEIRRPSASELDGGVLKRLAEWAKENGFFTVNAQTFLDDFGDDVSKGHSATEKQVKWAIWLLAYAREHGFPF